MLVKCGPKTLLYNPNKPCTYFMGYTLLTWSHGMADMAHACEICMPVKHACLEICMPVECTYRYLWKSHTRASEMGMSMKYFFTLIVSCVLLSTSNRPSDLFNWFYCTFCLFASALQCRIQAFINKTEVHVNVVVVPNWYYYEVVN